MPTTTFSDGIVPHGTYEITVLETSELFILRNFNRSAGGSSIEYRSKNGFPLAQKFIPGFEAGSADLQLASATQVPPAQGETFVVGNVGYYVESFEFSNSQTEATTGKITIKRCINPLITAPAADVTKASGGAITPIALTTCETVGTFTWAATGLPTGLSIVGTNITGTPSTPDTYEATITCTASASPIDGKSRVGSRTVTFTIT